MTSDHTRRTSLLDSVAIRIGYMWVLASFPDGSRPDVLRGAYRYSSRGRMLSSIFIGEAKATEGPNDADAVRRLAGYMEWVKGFLAYPFRGVTLAMCFDGMRASSSWKGVVVRLSVECGLPIETTLSRRVGQEDNVLMVRYRPIEMSADQPAPGTLR